MLIRIVSTARFNYDLHRVCLSLEFIHGRTIGADRYELWLALREPVVVIQSVNS